MKLIKHNKRASEQLVPVSSAWSPFCGLRRLQNDIDQLFEKPFGAWLAPANGFFDEWGPVIDVYEDKNKVYIKVELPGMKKQDIEVYLTEGLLNIAGERKEEAEFKDAKSYRNERYFGRFHRSIPLPTVIETKNIEAHYKDGVLTVTCPKTEEAKRKEIDVKVD